MDETLSGPASQKFLQREFYDFDDRRCQRLARISVALCMELRRTAAYRKRGWYINRRERLR